MEIFFILLETYYLENVLSEIILSKIYKIENEKEFDCKCIYWKE